MNVKKYSENGTNLKKRKLWTSRHVRRQDQTKVTC